MQNDFECNNKPKTSKMEKGHRWNQYLATLICEIISFCSGMLISWPSYTVPLLKTKESPLTSGPITIADESWLGGLPNIGGIIGAMIAGIIIQKCGRKWCALLSAFPFMICWFIVYFVKTISIILFARFIGGLGLGMTFVFVPIYVGEIAENAVRGMLASTLIIAYTSGILFSYIIGGLCSYEVVILINIGLSIIYAICINFIPESPIYLMERNSVKKAAKALSFYRGCSSTSSKVLSEIDSIRYQLKSNIELMQLSKNDDVGSNLLKIDNKIDEPINKTVFSEKKKESSWKILFSTKAARNAFFMAIILMILVTFTGMWAVEIYAGVIFRDAAPDLSPDICSAILALIILIGSLLSASVTDRIGRRILLLASTLLLGISLLLLSILLHTKIAPNWIPVALICLSVFLFNLGPGTVTFVLVAECFTPEVRSLATTLVMKLMWFLCFILISAYAPGSKLIGAHGMFYTYTVISFLAFLYIYFKVPETKGLSVADIQKLFNGETQ